MKDQEYISLLEDRIEVIEKQLARLLRREIRTRKSQRYLSWTDAANMLGLSGKNPAEAIRRRVLREMDRPGGVEVRLIRGGVRREDFEECLRRWETRRPSEAAVIRKAIEVA